MSVESRGRRIRYDNISVGSATGWERTVANTSVTKVELHGGGFATSTSTGDVWHSNLEVGSTVSEQGLENITTGTAAPTSEDV